MQENLIYFSMPEGVENTYSVGRNRFKLAEKWFQLCGNQGSLHDIRKAVIKSTIFLNDHYNERIANDELLDRSSALILMLGAFHLMKQIVKKPGNNPIEDPCKLFYVMLYLSHKFIEDEYITLDEWKKLSGLCESQIISHAMHFVKKLHFKCSIHKADLDDAYNEIFSTRKRQRSSESVLFGHDDM